MTTITAGPAVELSGLTKRFGDLLAVDSIELSIPAGIFFGIVGPNGAGKSTTLAMIAGLLTPDAGTVTVAGFDARSQREQVLGTLGIMMEGLSLPERLTGGELSTRYPRCSPGAVEPSSTCPRPTAWWGCRACRPTRRPSTPSSA